MKKIYVTGAKGFIGQSLCSKLVKSNRSVCGSVRSLDTLSKIDKVKYMSIGDIGPKTNWEDGLLGYDCIIHCAGEVHDMSKNDKLESYFLVNVDGTKRLAEQAAKAGVKRIVFLSSVKVNGESTDHILDSSKKKIKSNKIFTHTDLPNPNDPYSVSKFEAEKILWNISAKTGLEVVVVRIPVVYGYRAKGNLINLIKLVKFGLPLPFKAIKNQRSLIGIDNLVDVLIHCVDCPDAAGKIFLVSDGEDLSTPKLINYISSAMGRSTRLFSIPMIFLIFAGYIFGRQKEIERLVGSLQIDNSYARKVLNWTPCVSLEEGIRRMVQDK